MALLALKDLSFTYPNAEKKALEDISLQIQRGEFVTLLGATGSGKTTLLRMLKPELRPCGAVQGEICYDGRELMSLPPKESARRIGYVAQNPEEQIVTDKVWHELAFTLENLGAPQAFIARRVAETASYFDIDTWYHRDTAVLSGGQKQLLNLAAVMTADPDVLILDEPTAQLDPIAAARFIDTLRKLNLETGLTVVISEHRTEELIPLSDRVLILENGRVIYDDTPRAVAGALEQNSPYAAYLPAASRLFLATGGMGELPLSVREGQRYVSGFDNRIKSLPAEETAVPEDPALELKDIWFRYEKAGTDILRDLSLRVYKGEVFALLGANGAGKSTAAAVASGLRKSYHGSVRLFGKRLKMYTNGTLYRENLSLLPQDVESVFLCETVREELRGCEAIAESLPYDLHALYDRHPYDLSGGERQMVALCRALSTSPRLLIMDEPSKGLDMNAKAILCGVIKRLKQQGVTILLISHDIEFAALCADRCALFSQGKIAACESTERFMDGNRFYTTAAARITAHRYDGAYTVERAAALIQRNGGAR